MLKRPIKNNGGGIRMYIADTTDLVRDLFSNLEKLNENERNDFSLYLFNCINCNQINIRNEVNSQLIIDDIETFNFNIIGFSNDDIEYIIFQLLQLHNKDIKSKYVYDRGNVLGIEYKTNTIKNISYFERLSFFEKLDVIAEMIIRIFNSKIIKPLNNDFNEYVMAREICRYKLNLLSRMEVK